MPRRTIIGDCDVALRSPAALDCRVTQVAGAFTLILTPGPFQELGGGPAPTRLPASPRAERKPGSSKGSTGEVGPRGVAARMEGMTDGGGAKGLWLTRGRVPLPSSITALLTALPTSWTIVGVVFRTMVACMIASLWDGLRRISIGADLRGLVASLPDGLFDDPFRGL